MARTILPVSPYTPPELSRLTGWLRKHLPAAMAKARGVTYRQAAEGLPANDALGLPEIEAMGVDAKTIQRTVEGRSGVRRGDQMDKMIAWVRKYLGSGPEGCDPGGPCPVCNPPRDRGPKRDRH